MKQVKLLLTMGLMLSCLFIGYLLGCNPEKTEEENNQPAPAVKETVFVEARKNVELELFKLLNQERNTKLAWETCLEKSAKERAMDIVERNYFSHEDPLTGKILAWKIIKTNCGEYRVAGENLVKDFREEAVLAHQALMNSELHRENIQKELFKQGAVGCHQGVCVQLFADLLR